MSKIKDSLTANNDAILKALPQEFHADFEKQLAAEPSTDPAPLTGDAEISAIKAELVANPGVDESAAAGELKEITAPAAAVLASEAEQKAEETKAFTAMTEEVAKANS